MKSVIFPITNRCEAGNVLFIILIAVALFAALSYAVTQDRTSVKDSSGEQQKLDQAVIDNYMTCLNQGRMTLELARGCSAINYDPPSAWSGDNFNCHMFHPQGAGCAYQDLDLGCDAPDGGLSTLEVGESCGNIVYAGISGGNRIYTTKSDQGSAAWDIVHNRVTIGANSNADGLANTNIAVGISSDYEAANLCRSLGDKWYLPAHNEMGVLYDNRDEGELGGTITTSYYWTSSESGNDRGIRFRVGNFSTQTKSVEYSIRCIRRD